MISTPLEIKQSCKYILFLIQNLKYFFLKLVKIILNYIKYL
jgi:hypothetical protein